MARMIALDNQGSVFQAKIIDCQADTIFDLTDVVDQFIVFYKTDGTRFEKQGILVEDLPDNPGQFFIQYENTAADSILDLIGKWEYTGKVQLSDGDFAEASTRLPFWVV